MTEAGPPEADRIAVTTEPPRGVPEPAALVPSRACPFLVSESGAWRMATPARDHRCGAFAPATSLAPLKQARLCLTANHLGCATYLASMSAREARIGPDAASDRGGRWAFARTTPIVEELGGARSLLGALLADRRTWPAIPAVLLVSLLLALGLSGVGTETPVTALGSPTDGPPAPTGQSSGRPTPTADVVLETLGPSPTVQSTAPPKPTAPPATFSHLYRVKAGDTLSAIAARFSTTVTAISRLNGLSTTNLRIGQVLKIP